MRSVHALVAAIGIDLGTHASCVYALRGGEPSLVPSRTGQPTTPSWVAFTDEQILVGRAAQRQAITNPSRSIFGFKRLLGRKYHSQVVRWLRELSPYEIVPASNGDVWVRVSGLDLSPEEITSYLLSHLVELAEEELKQPIDALVLTVPSCFDEAQRRATLTAARLAGLDDVRLVSDTLAGALGALWRQPAAGRVAVVDFGAGHLDAAVLEHSPDLLATLAATGDPLLGGDDLDRRVLTRLADELWEGEGVDVRASPTALQRLFEVSNRARHDLSQARRSSPIQLPLIARDGERSIDLDREGMTDVELDELVAADLGGIDEPCAWVLEDSGYGTDDLEDVLLLGGMARVPAVHERLMQMFRRRPRPLVHPEQLAARGAALLAGGAEDLPDLSDVTAHSVGIKVRGGQFSPILVRNRPLPCRGSKRFTAVRKDQRHVLCEVYQGDAELVNETRYLGRLALTEVDLQTGLEVVFCLDEDGLLSIELMVPGEGERPVPLRRASGLSELQIEEIVAQRRLSWARRLLPLSVAPPSLVSATSTPTRPEAGGSAVGPTRSRPGTPRRRTQSVPDTEAVQLPKDALVGTVVSGRYLVEDVVGEGGMGRVYRVRHLVLDKLFALKVLHAELAANADLADRFVREAQTASAVGDEHVVDISDFGRLDDGSGFFVMEYLEGPSLLALIRERGGLEVPLVLDLGSQLAAALEAAHAKGVIHRDLKPENVTLVDRRGYTYFCKILDFGIAKSPTSDSKRRITLAGMQLGTPHYMAPEQILGGDVDARSDVYALGAVLLEMLTGATVFQAGSVQELLLMHLNEAPTPVSGRGRACPTELDALILECLNKDPAQRPQTAGEVYERLEALRAR